MSTQQLKNMLAGVKPGTEMQALAFTPKPASVFSRLSVCVVSCLWRVLQTSAEQAVNESCPLPVLTLARPQSLRRETGQRRKNCFENTCLC